MNTYDQGDLIRVRGGFTNRELTPEEAEAFAATGALPVGAGQDPTTVTFKVKNPAGAIDTFVYATDVEVVKQAGGSYYVEVSADSDGQWWTRWVSTGTGQAAVESSFFVKSEFS